MTFWQTLESWFESAWTAIKSATPATIPPAATLHDKLVALITHENGNEGPFPGTGGMIYANAPAETADVAALILANADASRGLTVPLFAAWIRNESNFSPRSVNPNKNKAVPGETPYQAYLHSDLGIAQISGRELSSYPGMAGLQWQEQQAKALDPTWAVPAMAQFCIALIAWAKEQQASAGSDPAWGLDSTVLACQAYNQGRTGALNATTFTYGLGVVARAKQYAQELGV